MIMIVLFSFYFRHFYLFSFIMQQLFQSLHLADVNWTIEIALLEIFIEYMRGFSLFQGSDKHFINIFSFVRQLYFFACIVL